MGMSDWEARVVRSLLASEPISDKERIRRSGVPPRTFHRARSKAYASGWVLDRYVPNPLFLGLTKLSFNLARPFAEDLETLAKEWISIPSVVHLWKGRECLFAVAAPELFVNDLSKAGNLLHGSERITQVIVDVRRNQAPVYFDFEGAWSRFVGTRYLISYPHALPSKTIDGEPSLPRERPDFARLRELVSRPFQPRSAFWPNRVGPYFLTPSQSRLLSLGAAEFRTMLSMSHIPSYQNHQVQNVAFLHGMLARDANTDELLLGLIDAGVAPFLFVTDGLKVMLGTLSPAPPTQSNYRAQSAVLRGLQQYLTEIEIRREPLESLSVLLNHRYDRMFP